MTSRSSRPTTGLGLVAADIFCGAGGMSEGFRASGYDVAFALDFDADSCDTYAANHPDTDVAYEHILGLSVRSLAQRIGDADVIVGGPSCQNFSTHGRSTGWHDKDDERNKLWRHLAHVVRAVEPKAFLLENVPGLTYYKNDQLGGTIIRRFEKLGYEVHRAILLAADYGVPQLRRRVFVVGVRKGLAFRFPEPTHLGGWRRDTQELWERQRRERGLLRHITSWEAIADLPRLVSLNGHKRRYRDVQLSQYAALMRIDSDDLRDHEASRLSALYAELVPYVPRGGTWRDIPPHLLPDRYRGMRRSDSTNLLGRLDPNRPAYTITTQFNNVTAGCFIHPYEDRPLSVREGARLQSFPDRYEFIGAATSRCRQIGNAVPPRIAQFLACAIAESVTSSKKGRRANPPKTVKSTRPAMKLTPPSAATKARMVGQARRNTAPELALRKALSVEGLRYRVNRRPIPDLRIEADVVFPTERVAVFADGCFWHGCPKHSRDTKSNTKWWAAKIATNKQRDDENTAALKKAGWRVVRVWEHEDPAIAATRVRKAVERRRAMIAKART